MNISIKSLYNWYRNTLRHPKYRWWLILGSLVYLLSPLDIAPDFIPIVGWIDDGIIMSLLVSEVSQMLIEFANKGKKETETETSDRPTEAANVVNVDAVTVEE
ncbi:MULTISPECIES: YkvA family protein [Spirulina sp. CCY15215]|uniref:YkvA family protein n=1 Tax=Spirulina sp. CCY15215 TaxID=2767591 RepID=UPI0019529AD3|nr:YkvA family protein [Spirulina major]